MLNVTVKYKAAILFIFLFGAVLFSSFITKKKTKTKTRAEDQCSAMVFIEPYNKELAPGDEFAINIFADTSDQFALQTAALTFNYDSDRIAFTGGETFGGSTLITDFDRDERLSSQLGTIIVKKEENTAHLFTICNKEGDENSTVCKNEIKGIVLLAGIPLRVPSNAPSGEAIFELDYTECSDIEGSRSGLSAATEDPQEFTQILGADTKTLASFTIINGTEEPTVTPTNTPIPTSTMTPTPSPVPNQAPYFTTRTAQVVWRGNFYYVLIEAADADNDYINMRVVSALPLGVGRACRGSDGAASCRITGSESLRVKQYSVTFEVSDSIDKTVKTFNINVE